MRLAPVVLLRASPPSTPARAEAGAFGLGLILGQPTGITGAYGLSERTAIDAALGLTIFDGRDFYVHGEFLWYLPPLVRGSSAELSAYLGIGGFLVTHDDPVIGARAPFGLSLDFAAAPIELFLEVSVLLAVVPDFHGD